MLCDKEEKFLEKVRRRQKYVFIRVLIVGVLITIAIILALQQLIGTNKELMVKLAQASEMVRQVTPTTELESKLKSIILYYHESGRVIFSLFKIFVIGLVIVGWGLLFLWGASKLLIERKFLRIIDKLKGEEKVS